MRGHVNKMRSLAFVLVCVLIIGGSLLPAAASGPDGVDNDAAAELSRNPLRLERSVTIEGAESSRGGRVNFGSAREAVLRLTITNGGHEAIQYTLIEEVASGAEVTTDGSATYNRTAGILLWRGDLEPGEQVTHGYSMRLAEDALGSIPLYAYVNSSSGAFADSSTELVRIGLAEARPSSRSILRDPPEQTATHPDPGIVVKGEISIVEPREGQLFADREQIDIVVEFPVGAEVELFVNGEHIGTERIGAIALDAEAAWAGQKYIAIPLAVGPNTITAMAKPGTGLTGDASGGMPTLRDEIVVFRSGPAETVSVRPLGPIATGGVKPLAYEIVVTDEFGFPPADGAFATVSLTGGAIVSPDEQPDWLGHQVELTDGRGVLHIEAPQVAMAMDLELTVGGMTAYERLVVTAEADEWFILGGGFVRASFIGEGSAGLLNNSAALRFIARGPLSNGSVLTAAVDTTRFDYDQSANAWWTGDTSTAGVLGASTGTMYARVERELSYVQLGRGSVLFAGVLSKYDRTHDGLQAVLDETKGVSVRAFVAREPLDLMEHTFEGDGTGFYRLPDGDIDPHSEQLAIVVRDRLHPHNVIRTVQLHRSRYYIDYATGRIILAEPLAATDEDGNATELRVRYTVAGVGVLETVGGLQATFAGDTVTARATGLKTVRPLLGPTVLMAAGVDIPLHHGAVFTAEGALSRTGAGAGFGIGASADTEGTATVIGLTYPDVKGWHVSIGRRYASPQYVAVSGTVAEGTTSTLDLRKQLNNGLRLEGGVSSNRSSAASYVTQRSYMGARWRMGSWRTGLTLHEQSGTSVTPTLALHGDLGYDFRRGAVTYRRQQPLSGTDATRDTLEGRYDIHPRLGVTMLYDAQTSGAAPLENRLALGLTYNPLFGSTQTTVHSGYELRNSNGTPHASVVHGAKTQWKLNDQHGLDLSLEQRNPLQLGTAQSFSSAIGWNYRYKDRLESGLRLDMRTEASRTKHALTWQGVHRLGEYVTLRATAGWLKDYDGTPEWQASLGGAYRRPEFVALVTGATGVQGMGAPTGQRSHAEWRLKTAYEMKEDTWVNFGYATRTVDQAAIAMTTNTDKLAFGLTWRLSERYAMHLEHSLLQQHETNTSRQGTMLGLSRYVTDDVWLTFGYAHADYVGFDLSGAGFARTQAGIFLELNFAFDESSFARWLAGK